jgi:tryptophan 7-halogenase
MKKIVILGGGTAGWITALYLNKIIPNISITLIEGKTTSTIGVGEATTPHFVDFLHQMNIDVFDFIKKTQGTIKNGISFENWNGNNKKYFHHFGEEKITDFKDYICFLKYLHNKKLNFNDYIYSTKISYENKVNLDYTYYALHFDNFKVAEYFKEIGQQRGIKVIIDDFEKINTNDDNDITSIDLKTHKKIKCDFIFDCSGFSRLIIQKHYNINFKDYKDYLPMKRAIIAPKEIKEKLFPYTKSICMKYGWVFEIPLQYRIGRGYIFDSDYISDEQAVKELETHYNEKLKDFRVINFNTGRMEKTWIKNCMSIGLSHSFLEPIESTSIYVTLGQLNTLKDFIPSLFTKNNSLKQTFNDIMNTTLDRIADFIFLHYCTKRKDSLFWKEFKTKYKPSINLKNIIDKFDDCSITEYDIKDFKTSSGFGLYNHMMIIKGLELMNHKFDLDFDFDLKKYKTILNINSVNDKDIQIFLNNLK